MNPSQSANICMPWSPSLFPNPQHFLYPSTAKDNNTPNFISPNEETSKSFNQQQHIDTSYSKTPVKSSNIPIYKTAVKRNKNYDSACWNKTSKHVLSHEQKRKFKYNLDYKKSNSNTPKSLTHKKEQSNKSSYKASELCSAVRDRGKQLKNCNLERKKVRNSSSDRKKLRIYSDKKNPDSEGRQLKKYNNERERSINSAIEKRRSGSHGNESKWGRNRSDSVKSNNLNHETKWRSSSYERRWSKKYNQKREESGNSKNEKSKLSPTSENKKWSNDRECSNRLKNEFKKSKGVSSESAEMKTLSHYRRHVNSEEETMEREAVFTENILLIPRKKNIKEFKLSAESKHSHHSQSRDTNSAYQTSKNSSSNDLQSERSRHINSKSNDANSQKGGMRNSVTSKYTWIRCSPADLYYLKDEKIPMMMNASQKLKDLHQTFECLLVKRAARMKRYGQVKLGGSKYKPSPNKPKFHKHEVMAGNNSTFTEEEDTILHEFERKKNHPYRLHEKLWYNDPGEMNDGPLCKCSAKARRSGICHDLYAGESSIPLCNQYSNNVDKLHHYRISITPTTANLSDTPTIIHHDGHDFTFEGFSILSHFELPNLPHCKFIHFGIEYFIHYVKEDFPENFTVAGLDLFSQFLFTELLELVDLNWKIPGDGNGCNRFHILPRFSRHIEANGKELLSLNVILQYLLKNNQLFIEKENLSQLASLSKHKWETFAKNVKNMIVTCPGMKPSSIRIDQLNRELCDSERNIYPKIIHFSFQPLHVSCLGIPAYRKLLQNSAKFNHILSNKQTITLADQEKLRSNHMKLKNFHANGNLKRNVTVTLSSENFYKTGIRCDIVEDAMMLPILIWHLRFHLSLNVLEDRIDYKFKDRSLLQLALTHPNFKSNFGTNRDHAKNTFTNCGKRQTKFGNQQLHYRERPKHGINRLENIMSSFGNEEEISFHIDSNQRLEFLGDSVIEFVSTVHLFFIFYDQDEGFLTERRSAVIQNQQLADLAKNLQLQEFMLFAHGPQLCGFQLERAMANCFEALMAAIFLDGGINIVDCVFGKILFPKPEDFDLWENYPPHQLQEDTDDQKWISFKPLLQKLNKFEEAIGIEFTHIRLLARAMMHPSMGYNYLTEGSNQRLEFLGDAVLQLIVSAYLYKQFPNHHEGHLTVLRTALVNNEFLADICDDLGMVEYAIYPSSKPEISTKNKADLLEAFLGALYVDKDLGYCNKFCEVCFFPRLEALIKNQDWNDLKTKLQQCCLRHRTMYSGNPDVPVYKVIDRKGPSNSRIFVAAVYFCGKRLAVGTGLTIKQAEMSAAGNALKIFKNSDVMKEIECKKWH